MSGAEDLSSRHQKSSSSEGSHPGPLKRTSSNESTMMSRQLEDFLCPVCFDVIDEAMVTRCGHTFCNRCIVCSIRTNCRCPKCGKTLDGDSIFPNFLLNELVAKRAAHTRLERTLDLSELSTDEIRGYLSKQSSSLPLHSVRVMLEVLEARRATLEVDSARVQHLLLREFLVTLRRQRAEILARTQRELALVDRDLRNVQASLEADPDLRSSVPSVASSSETTAVVPPSAVVGSDIVGSDASSHLASPGPPCPELGLVSQSAGLSLPQTVPTRSSAGEESSFARRRRRVHAHLDDLVNCYFSLRPRQVHVSEATECVNGDLESGLSEFNEALSKLTRFSRMRPLASLNYGMSFESNIVSSIEFDKDQEMFAIAGVTKKIKLYDYEYAVRNSVDLHYPMLEMLCSSKVSCLSWNCYHKSILASSDYEGSVIIWDTCVGDKVQTFQEHEKRCWSVDFNHVDTNLMASASDDFSVKLWATNSSHSVLSLDAKVNVCCVKFNPSSRYHLAFGSADHSVHYYDLRNIKEPLRVFRDHQKAVSYVKFVDDSVLVSASTDSQLKMWRTTEQSCLRSFCSHINEKNFVGLTTDGNYVACGSEDNSLYVYYKGLSRYVLQYKFEPPRPLLERERSDDTNGQFVSALCWKSGSNVLVAANSQGVIKILELCS